MSRFNSKQDQDAHFRILVESVKNYAIFGIDLDGRINSWNPGAERMKGYTREEAIGQHFRMLFLPEDRERHKPEEQLREALAKGSFTAEEVRLRKDGRHFDAEVSLHVVRDGAGVPTGFVKVTEDITHRKNLEREARRRQEFQAHLAAIVGHDLRNPLQAIRLTAQQLRTRSPGDATSPLVERILGAAERAARIVSELLDLSQAQLGGGIPVARTRSDLHAAAARVIEEHRGSFPGRELTLAQHGDTTGDWDDARMMQAIANLLRNALMYSPPDSPVSVEVAGAANEVRVSVHNRAPAIPPALLPHLFKAFRRGVEGSTAGRSLGLGLYIVEQVVLAHGGRVEVQSTEEAGTTFSLLLPRTAPAPER